MKRITALVICLLICNTLTKAQTHNQEFGFQTDNDGYLAQGSDKYYTNGIFLFYRHALNVKSSHLANKILGFEAGQKMYNPQSGFIPAARYIDRPFAGYLYVGSTLNLLYDNESNIKLGAQVGVIGPASIARQTQEFIHRTFGFYPPEGWQYQIRNNAVLNLSAEYNKLIVRDQAFDLTLNAYGNLGNGFSGAGIGPMFRIGRLNALFNSVSTQSTVISAKNMNAAKQHELFFYYKPLLNYVAYDATVEGGLFTTNNDLTSQEVTLTQNRFIFSNQVGGVYNANRFSFDFSVVFHTKDVNEMLVSHQWGSLAVMYHFN